MQKRLGFVEARHASFGTYVRVWGFSVSPKGQGCGGCTRVGVVLCLDLAPQD